MINYRGIIAKYSQYLPVTGKTPIISLQEGDTPLIPAPSLAKLAGARMQVFLKFEGLNPTGSFKDRGMTMAISKAKEEGAEAVICASTGNTSASAAAYSARAGLQCFVILPKGAIALGKLAQAMMHGAKVIAIDGNFDRALEIVKEISERHPVTLVNSINPYRIEGQKTGAFEIVDQLGGRAPDYHFIPVGNAGNITAYWKGYKEYKRNHHYQLPRMMGWQAALSAPIVKGRPIKDPKTVATAIKIGNPASWKSAEAARDESNGMIGSVTDKQILAAYKHLSRMEGVFCEPASAASVAGFLKLAATGFFKKEATAKEAVAVCVLTGHGLKDPDNAIKESQPPLSCKPEMNTVLRLMGFKTTTRRKR